MFRIFAQLRQIWNFFSIQIGRIMPIKSLIVTAEEIAMPDPFKLFTEHPTSVNETYLEHMHMSGSFGVWLLLGTICAFFHALFPFLFEKTASGIIKKLYARMVSNRVVKSADVGGQNIGGLNTDGASFYHI